MDKEHPYRNLPGDPSGFWADQDLVWELDKDGSPLSIRASATIRFLREELIDPREYMRVANERGQALIEIGRLRERLGE